jgi:hypothetical protein
LKRFDFCTMSLAEWSGQFYEYDVPTARSSFIRPVVLCTVYCRAQLFSS